MVPEHHSWDFDTASQRNCCTLTIPKSFQDAISARMCEALRQEPHVENEPPSIREALTNSRKNVRGALARA
eukprot:3708753-Pyramimonas_sp.AAC.1